MKIIKVTSDDIVLLQEIGRKTFLETFADTNSEENMAKYLAEGFSMEKLRDEWSNENSDFYFAVVNEKVLGYLKLNFGASQTELQDESSMEIERIYVLKEYHGKRVGQILFEKAMQLANENSVNYVWLGVWEHNQRAIRFYEKNGFVAFDKHVFVLGDDEQTDIMMKKYL